MSRNQQKRPELTAVIVGDNFDGRFSPFLRKSDWSLKKIGALTTLESCLMWISRTCVTNVILVVSTENTEVLDQLQFVLNSYKGYFTSLLVSGKNVMSVGDAIREVEQRSLITGDFVLVHNVATLCSSKLQEEIENFRERRRKDKNNCLTLLYTETNHDLNPVIAVAKNTKKLMFYFKKERSLELDLDKEFYMQEAQIRRDLRDTGVALCAINVAAQFTDNFDFQERDDIIREILVNEELLCQNIHVEVISDKCGAATVQDYVTYLDIQTLMLQRWFHPVVPEALSALDMKRGAHCYARRNNIYISAFKQEDLIRQHKKIMSCRRNVYFDMGVTVGNGCKIENASFGKNVEIGDNVRIKNVRVGDNVVIGNNCRLQNCFIDDTVMIGHDCTVLAKTFIGEGVVIPNSTNVIEGGILVKDVPEEEDYGVNAERDSHYEVRFKHRTGFWKNSNLERRRARTYSNADHACDQTLDKLEVENEETDVMRFYNEVFDSMSQAVENMDSTEHRSNLILEINSSKLAYNMTMEDVAKNVFFAFLKLECCSELAQIKTLMQDWHHVFTNYYKPHKNQIQLLLALEEHCQTHPEIFKIANHIVHHLYSECDVLQEEAIFEWFGSLNTDSAMHAKIKPIIDWLEQSSDEEVESDEE